VAAATGNITNLNTTTGNVTTLNSTTINNAGATSTNSLAVGVGGVSVAAGAPVSMGGNRVQNVATPVAPTDAANKAYVDSISGNVANMQAEIDAQTARINSAFKEIDRNTVTGLALPRGKALAIGANLGFFRGKQAGAAQAAVRLDSNLTLNGGIGLGFGSNQVGGRVGLMAAW